MYPSLRSVVHIALLLGIAFLGPWTGQAPAFSDEASEPRLKEITKGGDRKFLRAREAAALLEQSGYYDQAVVLLEQVGRDPSVPTGLLVQLGELQERLGKNRAAEATFKSAVQRLGPEQRNLAWDIHLKIGRSALYAGDFNEAIAALDESWKARTYPRDNPDAFLLLAEAYQGVGRLRGRERKTIWQSIR